MNDANGLTPWTVMSASERDYVSGMATRALTREQPTLDALAEVYVRARTRAELSPAGRFFFDHAGFSYNTDEHPDMGHARHSQELANAESWARDAGMSFHWEIDPDTDSSEFAEDEPVWKLWMCTGYTSEGALHQSLGAVDFGRDGEPWDAPYRRVVEAELALQEMLGE